MKKIKLSILLMFVYFHCFSQGKIICKELKDRYNIQDSISFKLKSKDKLSIYIDVEYYVSSRNEWIIAWENISYNYIVKAKLARINDTPKSFSWVPSSVKKKHIEIRYVSMDKKNAFPNGKYRFVFIIYEGLYVKDKEYSHEFIIDDSK